MEALKQMILEQGKGIGSDIVKVDMFLNHRIDTALLFQMGEAWAEEFRGEKPELVLTVEASGIAMAVAAAHALGDIPVVFAKKNETALKVSQAVTETKIEALRAEMSRHNSLIERTYKLEGKMEEVRSDIQDLKAFHKPN